MRLKAFNITGDGAAHTLASATKGKLTKCKWFQLLVTAGQFNIGEDPDSVDIDLYPITAGGAQFQPPIALAMELYDLTGIWYFAQANDTAVLLCAF